MGTIIVGAVIALIAGVSVRSLIKDKKSGKACAGCSGCPSSKSPNMVNCDFVNQKPEK